jgi:hypothetical protein
MNVAKFTWDRLTESSRPVVRNTRYICLGQPISPVILVAPLTLIRKQDIWTMIKEAIEIRLLPQNFNRDGGFTLSQSWYLVTSNAQPIQRYTNMEARPSNERTRLALRFKHGLWVGTQMGQSESSYIKALMMGTEMVSEMLAIFNLLTWLRAQEDFINHYLHHSLCSLNNIFMYFIT